MVKMREILRIAAVHALERAVDDLRLEEEIEAVALSEAQQAGRPLVNHHWQSRFCAEQRLRAANALLEAIDSTYESEKT